MYTGRKSRTRTIHSWRWCHVLCSQSDVKNDASKQDCFVRGEHDLHWTCSVISKGRAAASAPPQLPMRRLKVLECQTVAISLWIRFNQMYGHQFECHQFEFQSLARHDLLMLPIIVLCTFLCPLTGLHD